MTSKSRKKLSREQERNLDIEIGFLEGVVRRDPTYIEALQVLGDVYTRRGRFDEGLKVDEQLSRLRPADALVHYNLACSYSLTEQFEAAAAALNLETQNMSRSGQLSETTRPCEPASLKRLLVFCAPELNNSFFLQSRHAPPRRRSQLIS